jgi:hypothetical protein
MGMMPSWASVLAFATYVGHLPDAAAHALDAPWDFAEQVSRNRRRG